MTLLRKLAIRKMQKLEEWLREEGAELISKKEFWDFMYRAHRCLEVRVVHKKIYIRETRGDEYWVYPFDHWEEYDDALASALEYLEDESRFSAPPPRR